MTESGKAEVGETGVFIAWSYTMEDEVNLKVGEEDCGSGSRRMIFFFAPSNL